MIQTQGDDCAVEKFFCRLGYGYRLTQPTALNHPERMDKLIVADIAPVSYTHCFNNLIQALKSLPLHEISNRKQAEQFLASAIPDLREPLLIET